MKTNLKLNASIIGVLFLLLSISVNAQSRNALEVNIPFEFTVAGDVFEAGDYVIERLNPQKESMLILKAADGDGKKVFLTHKVKAEEAVDSPNLVFVKIDETFFLSQIWSSPNGNGLELLKSKKERKREKLAKVKKERITVLAKN